MPLCLRHRLAGVAQALGRLCQWSSKLGDFLAMANLTTQDGTTIHYVDSGGDGPPVLLVHGITESARTWDPVIELLEPYYRVIAMDLRGHGESSFAERYDLEAMTGDVVAVIQALDIADRVHIVGHSLGGAVVSAVGAAVPVASVVDVDQSLQLGAFKAQLADAEAMLKDSSTFGAVIESVFAQMAGPKLSVEEIDRVDALRRPTQEVVLGVWELLFTMSEAEINQVVISALGGYANNSVPYLALFGIDPDPDYPGWLTDFITGAEVEIWADHGHYPHLVDPQRFVARLESFWK
jgi:pimeloyl-ACP methyl ester carboxylesterase